MREGGIGEAVDPEGDGLATLPGVEERPEDDEDLEGWLLDEDDLDGDEDEHWADGDGRRRLGRLAFWRSPSDQPGWARPVLLVLAGLAGFSYAWGISNFPLEPFYAAAVRSMGSNWHDFFFGAVDPMGTVSLDKLPGAFWVQALFVRDLGFHYWIVALPQAIAGVLTVLVLYRAVRRLVGPKAGLVAALVVVVSPASALLNRGNVSDPFLVLLTVLAADATAKAVTTGRLRTLLLAGVWVGLAFQTKMVQAWMVVPALFLVYLVAAPPSFRRRLGHTALAGLVILVVSISWMAIVTAVPSHDRPYVDGTRDDNVFTQVFVYDGWSRLGIHVDADKVPHGGQPFLNAALSTTPDVGTFHIQPSWHRLLTGPLGRDVGWLLPVALASALGVLIARRRADRRDPTRAAVLMWLPWLVILFAFFSAGTMMNSYYTGALVPAVAALCATGLAVVWRARKTSRSARVLMLLVVPATTVYAIWLIPAHAGVRWWLVPLAIAVCAAAELSLVFSLRLVGREQLGGDLAIAMAALSVALVPAVTTGVVVADGLGSFSTPYQSAAATKGTTTLPELYQTRGGEYASYYERRYPSQRIVMVDDTAALAAPHIMVTGREFLPVGGFGGSNPSPTLGRLEQLVKKGQARWFVVPVSPLGHDPRMAWVRAHCLLTSTEPYSSAATLGVYDCRYPPLPRESVHGEPSEDSAAAESLEQMMTEAMTNYRLHDGYNP